MNTIAKTQKHFAFAQIQQSQATNQTFSAQPTDSAPSTPRDTVSLSTQKQAPEGYKNNPFAGSPHEPEFIRVDNRAANPYGHKFPGYC